MNQQRALATMGQRRGQIDRRRGFADAAFLIRNRDDGSHLFLPPPACPERTRRACAQAVRSDSATGFLYMGAVFRKPPKPTPTLRFQAIYWQRKSARNILIRVENPSPCATA